MTSIIQENKLFSFDGKNIHFYCQNKNGKLKLADENFNEKVSNKKTISGCHNTEHANVGDIAFQIFFNSLSLAEQKDIKENLQYNNLANFREITDENGQNLYVDLTVGSQKIRAGMLVSFGGYYSIHDEPIAYDVVAPINTSLSAAQLEKRFLAAFQTLSSETNETAKIIAQQIGMEGHTIHGLIKRKARPSIVMGAVKEGQITWVNHISRSLGWKKHIPGGSFIDQYLQAATMNFDHFGKEAETAYQTGHRIALQAAEIASCLEGQSKWIKFTEALSIELFACHFFADLFVSGHVRTPRRQVFEVLNSNNAVKKKWIAALFANIMHDEDNENGVYVCSENHPDPWEAIGDYRYADDNISDEGEKIIHQAIAARLCEIYNVYAGKVKWQDVATLFKKDIPKEISLTWFEHCKTQKTLKKSQALLHADKNLPFLTVDNNQQLNTRPKYQAITKKDMMLHLADILANGIQEEVNNIENHTIQEITRITPIINKLGQTEEKENLSTYLALTDDPLQQIILQELYLLDEADEVVVAIEGAD